MEKKLHNIMEKKNFLFSGAKIFNEIPFNIANAETAEEDTFS